MKIINLNEQQLENIEDKLNTFDENYITYTVKSGDSLWLIANRYNTTVDSIKRINNLTSNNLSIGQVLIISEEVDIPLQPDNAIIYTVQSGDTLYKIADQYGVSGADIIELNNLGTTVLNVGQQLLIPNKSIDTTTTYTVNVPDNSEYRLYMSVLKDKNMGKFKIYVNDKLLNQEFDFYGDEQMHICDLGSIQNCKKGAKVKIECIGNNPLSAGTAFLTTGFHLAK